KKLAFADAHIAGAQAHGDSAFDHQEQLVFVLMMMPHELALELDQLDVGIVQLAGDFWLPVFVEAGKLFGEINFFEFHGPSSFDRPLLLPSRTARGQSRRATHHAIPSAGLKACSTHSSSIKMTV